MKGTLRHMEDRIKIRHAWMHINRILKKNIDLMDQFVKLMVRTIPYTLETYHVWQMREIYTIMILFFLKTEKKKCLERN